MPEHVYESSVFWALVSMGSKASYFLYPWLLALGGVLLAVKHRIWPSYLVLAGVLLVAGATAVHIAVPEVRTIALGGQQPLVGENGVIVFFYLHGLNFGYLFLGAGLLSHALLRRAGA
jgi:hypothetical protein